MKYYILKEGAYVQGVMWIGNDLGVGITILKDLASKDSDNYHYWNLYEYSPSTDIEDDLLYSCKKDNLENSV